MGLRATLVSLENGPNIRIDKTLVVIGRSPTCDVIVDSKKVSRQHCCLARLEDHLVARDLGSTNGIRINGQRVEEGTVYDGDDLTIGNLHYQFALHEGKEPPAVEPKAPKELPKPTNPSNEFAGTMVSDEELEEADAPILLKTSDHLVVNRPLDGMMPKESESAPRVLAQSEAQEAEGREPASSDLAEADDAARTSDPELPLTGDEEPSEVADDADAQPLEGIPRESSGWLRVPDDVSLAPASDSGMPPEPHHSEASESREQHDTPST